MHKLNNSIKCRVDDRPVSGKDALFHIQLPRHLRVLSKSWSAMEKYIFSLLKNIRYAY